MQDLPQDIITEAKAVADTYHKSVLVVDDGRAYRIYLLDTYRHGPGHKIMAFVPPQPEIVASNEVDS